MIRRLEQPIDLTANYRKYPPHQEQVIVIGYGNTLRSDDGAGQKVAEILASWHLPQVKSISVHQLTPELSALIAAAELAIFIDVYPAEQSELAADNNIRVISIDPTTSRQHPTSPEAGHIATPDRLLYLADLVYGKTPSAWWILLPAWNFEFGEHLSPLTTAGIEQALHHITHLIWKSMHELSLMAATLEIALEYAQRESAQQILQLNLRVGAMSGVVPEALEFAFAACTQATIAAGAQLAIEVVPALCYCQNCDREFTPADLIYACPDCGKLSSKLLQGRELQLISLEVA